MSLALAVCASAPLCPALPENLIVKNDAAFPVTVDYEDPSDVGFNLSVEINPTETKTIPALNTLKGLMITLHRVPLGEDETTSIDIPAGVYTINDNQKIAQGILQVTSQPKEQATTISAQLSDETNPSRSLADIWTYTIATEQQETHAPETRSQQTTAQTQEAPPKKLGEKIASSWQQFKNWIRGK